MNEDNSSMNSPEKVAAQAGGEQRAQTYPGKRKRTQEEQNRIDDETRKEAMRELVASWMERLQLISVITTFFASAEAVMVGVVTRDVKDIPMVEQASNAALLGALVLHISAAIISFLAAFFLVNYRVHEARKEEVQAEGGTFVETPLDIFETVADPVPQRPKVFKVQPKRVAINGNVDPPIWSSNPHLVQVGPFRGQPPANVLGRCHSLSVFLATVGFMLGVIGIGCFAWARQAQSVSIFITICIATSVILGVGILIVPDIKFDESGGRRVTEILRIPV